MTLLGLDAATLSIVQMSRNHRTFIETLAPVGPIDGVNQVCQRWTSLLFGERRARGQAEQKIADLEAQIEANRDLSTSLAFD